MKRTLGFCFVFLSAAVAALGSNEVEQTAPVRITPNNGFAFYQTTGITIGNYLYVYHQGGGGPGEDNSCAAGGDKIIAYRALLTNGVPGTFQRVGRVSPCVFSPVTNPAHPQHPNPPASYEPGQIFRATVGGVTKYHMLADVSETISFYNVWRGETLDGINWKWWISDDINNQQFNGRREVIKDAVDVLQHTIDIVVQPESFIHTNTIFMLTPILLSTNGGVNNAQWWGFFNFWSNGFKVGQMSIDWDAAGTPTVKMVTNVSGTTYTWRTLTPTGGPAGSFLVDFVPWTFRTNINARTLINDTTTGSGFQLWAHSNNFGGYGTNVGCDTTRALTCTQSGGCLTGDGSGCPQGMTCNVFLRNTGDAGEVMSGGGSGFVWWSVSRFSFGAADNVVYSHTRALPSGYEVARLYPFRWNSPTGRRYLFSTTNDANICSEFLFSPFYKMYIVKTELAVE